MDFVHSDMSVSKNRPIRAVVGTVLSFECYNRERNAVQPRVAREDQF